MSLQHELDLALNSIAVLGPGDIVAHGPQGEVRASLEEVNNLGVAFTSLGYFTPSLKDAATSRLSQIADQLTRKLTYLLEPLRVVEIDGQAGAVQLRSHPPYKRENETTYYEVLVERGGSITVSRFEKLPLQARKLIVATVTSEVFHRMVDDLINATS